MSVWLWNFKDGALRFNVRLIPQCKFCLLTKRFELDFVGYSLADILKRFMKEIDISNAKIVGYSLIGTLNPFIQEINIPYTTFTVTSKKTH